MSIETNPRDESKNLSVKREDKKDVYISYNSIAQSGEKKSVSKAMHEFIKQGFAKFTLKKA
ncbi:MAG TPA: hypothetical protein VHN59_06885 [Chitinophagaceae bacterium]|nr:hypothetical protein [Chitinophagaceae bacterium]